MWLLQIFFVNNYYEKMKIIESEKMTSDIIMSYRNGNQEILLQNIDKITMQDDVFIRIERKGTEPIVYSKELNAYKGEMEIVRRSLNKKKGKNKSVTMILTGKKTQRKTWAYGCYLDKNRNDILFVLSPLYPVTSTDTNNVIRSTRASVRGKIHRAFRHSRKRFPPRPNGGIASLASLRMGRDLACAPSKAPA